MYHYFEDTPKKQTNKQTNKNKKKKIGYNNFTSKMRNWYCLYSMRPMMLRTDFCLRNS